MRRVKCIDDEEKEVNGTYCVQITKQQQPRDSAYCFDSRPCLQWIAEDWQPVCLTAEMPLLKTAFPHSYNSV